MKRIKLLALVAALLPCLSQGAVNVITKNFGTGALAATSNPILFNGLAPAGAGTVAVGYFNGLTDAQISAVGSGEGGNAIAWALVAASFQQFGASVTMGTGAGAAPGTPGLFQSTPGANVAGTISRARISISLLATDRPCSPRPKWLSSNPTPRSWLNRLPASMPS